MNYKFILTQNKVSNLPQVNCHYKCRQAIILGEHIINAAKGNNNLLAYRHSKELVKYLKT